MSTVQKLFLNLSFLGAAALTAAPLDKGGVTFDFKKISAELFKPAAAVSQSENLVTNADGSAKEAPRNPLRWQPNYCYLHTREIPAKDARRTRAFKTVKWTIKDGVFTVTKPEELKSFLPPKVVRSTSGGWRKNVNLPHDKGGLYKVTFQYRGQLRSAGGCCLLVSGNTEVAGRWWKGKGKFFRVYRFSLSPEWQNYQNVISLAPGIKSLELVPRIDGTGVLEFRNMAVVPVAAASGDNKITLQLSPMGRLDHTFALAQGLPGTITYIWKRNCPPEKLKLKRPQLVVRLPKEVIFHAPANLKFLGKKATPAGVEYRIDLTSWRNRPVTMPSFDFYLRMGMLISTQAAPGTKLSQGAAWVEDQNKKISNTIKVNYKVIPSFRAAKANIFKPGFYTGGVYMNYSDPADITRAAKMYDAAGVRWIVGNQNSAFPIWRKAGVTAITPELYFIANGFRIGPPQGRPEADKYKTFGSHHKQEIARSVCPAAVYEKRPFFLKSTVPYIQKGLKGADGLWANWEPYAYAGRGCFCDGCRKKFAKFVGVSDEVMKKSWPQDLAMGRKYYKQAVRFRSLEHAKLMNTLNEVITAATGGKKKSMGFIPGVQVDNMSSTWRENGFDKETHPIDYAGNFKWIDPWGPYNCWQSFTPYVYSKGGNLRIFLKAKDVRAAVNKDYKRHLNLLAFPHGHQGDDWVTQPEFITLSLLSFMFNGWEGATLYAYPKGYDARYWKAFADASDIAARYDKYVFKGKRVDEKVQLTARQPYAADTAVVEPLLGTHKYHRMLQHTAYELDGTLVLAAFNFWQEGEVFFTCKVKGLSPNTRYTVKSKGVRFTGKEGKSFTGRELARGVTLHAGAVRCAVYEIAPEKTNDRSLYNLSAASVAKLQKAALPALRKAKTEDDKYNKRNAIRDYKLENISNAGIVCKADNVKKRLIFTAGKNRAEFIAGAACVAQWTVNGKTVVHGGASSGFGAVAFWQPSLQLTRNYAVTGQKKIPGGIEVSAEIRILDRQSSTLAGATIRQTFRFTDKLQKIAVSSSVVNSTIRSLSFGVRYNLMPAYPALDGGFTRIYSKGKAVDFKRDMSRKLYTTGKDRIFETTVRKLFEVKSPNQAVDAKDVLFAAPGAKAKLTLEPKASLAGVAVWDSGRQVAGTFEPCFKYMTLGPGGKTFNISAVMTVEK